MRQTNLTVQSATSGVLVAEPFMIQARMVSLLFLMPGYLLLGRRNH
jgi:hypothetical protein